MRLSPVATIVQAPPADFVWEQVPTLGQSVTAQPVAASKEWVSRHVDLQAAYEYSDSCSREIWLNSQRVLEDPTASGTPWNLIE